MSSELDEGVDTVDVDGIFWRNKKRVMQFLIAAVICLGVQDVRKGECNVYCKAKGYDSGIYDRGFCGCINLVPYVKVFDKRLTLPRGPKLPSDKSAYSSDYY